MDVILAAPRGFCAGVDRAIDIVNMALEVCRRARTILGANGILDEYPIMRHMANLESVYTYEGTHDMHTLIIGQEVTGIPAYR